MPLAEYLATEQARDRLKTADVLTMPSASEWHGHGQRVVIEQCKAWWRVSVTVADETVSAYYRPDGDRYIVTDLGEGWRALRLRGIDWHTNDEIINKVDAVALPLMSPEPGYETSAPWGTLELRYVAAADLPDAICRVMLASLRVAGVQP